MAYLKVEFPGTNKKIYINIKVKDVDEEQNEIRKKQIKKEFTDLPSSRINRFSLK